MQSATLLRIRLMTMLSLLTIATQSYAMANLPGSYYVDASNLNVRLEPTTSAIIAGQLQRRQKIEVYEVRSGWARISEYYPSPSLKKNVAQWVSAAFLVASEADIRAERQQQSVLLKRPVTTTGVR